MKTILAAALSYIYIATPAFATPFYAGMRIGDSSVSALLGYPINKKYAVEAHYSKSKSSITHAGVTVDSAIAGLGVTGIALFPMKLNDVLPYFLFAKAGFERTNNHETYAIPSSVTLTLPYNGNINSHKNQFVFGGGAEYDFSKKVMGRMGVDLVGKNKSINLAAIFKF